MKIFHINCNYAGTVLHRHMISHLNEEGIENCVYVPLSSLKDVDVDTPGAKVVASSCFKKWHRFIFDYKQKKILSDLQKKCNVAEYDCIHAYTLFTDGNAARRLHKKYGLKYVVAVRSTDVNVFFKRLFYLRGRGVKILRDSSGVFFLSETYRKHVLQTYVPKKYHQEIMDKSYIMPNGIDDFWLDHIYRERLELLEKTRERLERKQLKVVFAGVVCERKNPIATQEALEILRKKGWEVSFTAVGAVGDEQLKEKMCVYPNTTYIQKQPKEALLDIYREHDLFVMPSHTETFGLVYSEALSQGLPVLYTKGQGFDGQFPDGVIGYPVDDLSPEDIAEKIEMAVSAYELLVKNAVAQAERFRWADICREYKEIYQSL